MQYNAEELATFDERLRALSGRDAILDYGRAQGGWRCGDLTYEGGNLSERSRGAMVPKATILLRMLF